MILFAKLFVMAYLAVLMVGCAVAACIKTVNENYPDSEKERKEAYGIAIGVVAFIAIIIGLSIIEIGLLYVWGIILGIAGVIFGVLILINFAK